MCILCARAPLFVCVCERESKYNLVFYAQSTSTLVSRPEFRDNMTLKATKRFDPKVITRNLFFVLLVFSACRKNAGMT